MARRADACSAGWGYAETPDVEASPGRPHGHVQVRAHAHNHSRLGLLYPSLGRAGAHDPSLGSRWVMVMGYAGPVVGARSGPKSCERVVENNDRHRCRGRASALVWWASSTAGLRHNHNPGEAPAARAMSETCAIAVAAQAGGHLEHTPQGRQSRTPLRVSRLSSHLRKWYLPPALVLRGSDNRARVGFGYFCARVPGASLGLAQMHPQPSPWWAEQTDRA